MKIICIEAKKVIGTSVAECVVLSQRLSEIGLRSVLLSVYGEKLGNEAYSAMKNAREGASYRKSGGPLVCAVSKDKAAEIREKETAIGMM